ncbi:MAG TPA: GNAT family N-acetyltransferase [Thermoanaerobaculia bacterium]|jgi:ribosomal-protein-alanine N-acetyltransferase|nr:GNAT family N-acetyltransferase [Thermoanaerobaculia bacterium]
MIIRDFLSADLERAYQLDQSCFEPGISFTRGQIRDFVRRPGAISLVAEPAGDAPMAALAIGQVSGHRSHVITIDVAAAQRRGGLGRRLFEELLSRFSAAGAKTVRLEVDVRNAAARRFYERMGFEETRRLPDYYGPGRDGLRMLREL